MIRLTTAQRDQIIDHAVRGQPNEICGLIGGWADTARIVIPIPNVASTPRNRYQLEPKAFIAAYHQIEKAGGELIGIYHSHPMGEPIPSATDIAEATWPDAVYLIIGFVDGQAHLAAWSLRGGKATAIKLIIT